MKKTMLQNEDLKKCIEGVKKAVDSQINKVVNDETAKQLVQVNTAIQQKVSTALKSYLENGKHPSDSQREKIIQDVINETNLKIKAKDFLLGVTNFYNDKLKEYENSKIYGVCSNNLKSYGSELESKINTQIESNTLFKDAIKKEVADQITKIKVNIQTLTQSDETDTEENNIRQNPQNTKADTNTNIVTSTNAGNLEVLNPIPTNTVATVSEEPPQPNQPANFTNLIFPALAVIVALTMAAVLSKKLFDSRKYGKNAVNNLGSLKKVIGAKNELTNRWLKRRKSANIHAIGVGKIDGTNDYCIQVFVDDANGDMLQDPPTQLLPREYQDFPIVIYEMPRADFLGLLGNSDSDFTAEKARLSHQTLRGGISGANANLRNEYGTIGYFFRPNFVNQAASLWMKKHIYMLSNSHVFFDLTKAEKDDSDMILHPSPGESVASKSVGELYKNAPIIFGGDVENPNFTDAAIAKIHTGQDYELAIPRIGKIDGYLKKEQVELRSSCQKFGRTTGYTQGKVFSIHLSIWVKYSAKAQEAFFKDQFLIIPTDAGSFVKSGDSGSLVADFENKAIGLIFAGAEKRSSLQFENVEEAFELENLMTNRVERIEHFGVANSISDVMAAFNLKIAE